MPPLQALYAKQFLEIKLFTFDYPENKSQRTVDYVPTKGSPLTSLFQNVQRTFKSSVPITFEECSLNIRYKTF